MTERQLATDNTEYPPGIEVQRFEIIEQEGVGSHGVNAKLMDENHQATDYKTMVVSPGVTMIPGDQVHAIYLPDKPQWEAIRGVGVALIGKTDTSGIPAMSGSTPGYSMGVELYKINTSTGDIEQALNDLGGAIQVTVYNLASSAIAASVFIQMKREMLSGALMADFENCG